MWLERAETDEQEGKAVMLRPNDLQDIRHDMVSADSISAPLVAAGAAPLETSPRDLRITCPDSLALPTAARFHELGKRRLVGLTRFELVTPRLSSVCSNQLSYRPRYSRHSKNRCRLSQN